MTANRAPTAYRDSSASIRIFGTIRDLNSITKSLGVQPSHTHRKGEPASRSVNYRHDGWILTAAVRRDRKLSEHLRWLQRRFKRNEKGLRQLSQQYDVDLYCSYHSNYDQGSLEFAPEVVKWCARVGMPIRISILVQD